MFESYAAFNRKIEKRRISLRSGLGNRSLAMNVSLGLSRKGRASSLSRARRQRLQASEIISSISSGALSIEEGMRLIDGLSPDNVLEAIRSFYREDCEDLRDVYLLCMKLVLVSNHLSSPFFSDLLEIIYNYDDLEMIELFLEKSPNFLFNSKVLDLAYQREDKTRR